MANNKDNWIHKSEGMLCKTCMYFVAKAKEGQIVEIGRCRRAAPTMNGFPVVYISDWCGDHKLDSDKLVTNKLVTPKTDVHIMTEEEFAKRFTNGDCCGSGKAYPAHGKGGKR